MVIIYRATTNCIGPTCREKELLTSPSYILRFKNDTTKDYRYCACTDSSLFPDRYQKLTVVETTTPTSLTNQIKLDNSKSWKLEVYEISAADLALVANFSSVDYTALTCVQKDRVRVLNTTETTPATYTGNQSTFKEYAG